MTRAFLFDMDGTLVDSLADIGHAMNFALRQSGFAEHAIDRYRMLVGEGVTQLVGKALPPGSDAHIDEVVQRYRARYRSNMFELSRPYEGIAALLDALRARGERLAIVTNKPQAMAEAIADALFGAGAFEIVVGEREGLARKPDPAPALLAASTLGMDARDCIFVGDTYVDIHTARAAKMKSVGVLWGFRDRAELEEAGADHIVTRPDEILAL